MKQNRFLFKTIALITCISAVSATTADSTAVLYATDRGQPQNIAVTKDSVSGVVSFTADFDLNADGSPRAYNPQNTGIVHNDNGRYATSKKWFAVVTVDSGPIIQDSTGPVPGNYISTTSLCLSGYKDTDYRRYVNADSIPYFVLPGGSTGFSSMGIAKGDIGLVHNTLNNKKCFAIFADVGPAGVLGEGSLKLAENLEIPLRYDKKGRVRGGIDSTAIVYTVFSKSGLAYYNTISVELINSLGIVAEKKVAVAKDLIKELF